MKGTTYLEQDWLLGRSRCSEVLHVSTALIVERRPTCLVLAVPLDDEVPVEEVLAWPHTSEGQEVSCLLGFPHQNVPGALWYHPHVHVPWESREGNQSRTEVMGWPTMAAATLTPRLSDTFSLMFNPGGLGVHGCLACVTECVLIRHRGGGLEVGVHCPVSVFYCVGMGGGWFGGGRKQQWVGLCSLMMFVGRCGCACVCVFVKGGGGDACPRCEPFEVSHIWAGYLEGMQRAASTHTERKRDCREEGGKEESFYCFRASFTMNLSSRYVDLAGACPSAIKPDKDVYLQTNMGLHACTLTSQHNGTNSCKVWTRLLPWQ